MSSQHRIENVTVRERPTGCELRCDGEGFTVCSEVLFVECEGDANIKYTDCGGPEMPVVLSPVVAGDAQIIQIDGVCYERVGPTQDPTTNTEFDYEFNTCQDCSDTDLSIQYINCANPSDIIYIDDLVTTADIVEVNSKCYSSTEYTETAPTVLAVDAEYTTCESCASTFSAIEYVDCAEMAPSLVIRESVAPGALIVRVDGVCYSSNASTVADTTHTAVDYTDYTDCADCADTTINAEYRACADGISEVIIPENQVPATDTVIEVDNVCYEFFQFTETDFTVAAPDASHVDCDACETYRLYRDCDTDTISVVISSQYTSYQTIKVDGVCYDFISTTVDTPTHTGVDIDGEFVDCEECGSTNRRYLGCVDPAASTIVADSVSTSDVIRIDGICYTFDDYTTTAVTDLDVDFEFEFCSQCETTALNMRFQECNGLGEIVLDETDGGGIIGVTTILQSSSECYEFIEYTEDVLDDIVSNPLVTYDDCDCCANMCCETLFALNVDASSAVDATEQHQLISFGSVAVVGTEHFVGDGSISNFGSTDYVTIVTRGNGTKSGTDFPDWGNTYNDPRHTQTDGGIADFHSCFNFGSDNFEVGLAWRTTDKTKNQVALAKWGAATTESWTIEYWPSGFAGREFYAAWSEAGMAGLGPDLGYWVCGGTPTISNNTWYWLEWTRVGGVVTFSIDGTVLETRAFSGAIVASSDAVSIGNNLNGNPAHTRGFIDSVYIKRNTGINFAYDPPSGLYTSTPPHKP